MPLTPEVFKRGTAGIHGGHTAGMHGGDIATKGVAFERGATWTAPAVVCGYGLISPVTVGSAYTSVTGAPEILLSTPNNETTAGRFLVRL